MKWICDKCQAINAQFAPKCHNCEASSPESAVVEAITNGVSILLEGEVVGPITKRKTYFLSNGEVHTVVSRSPFSYAAPLIAVY